MSKGCWTCRDRKVRCDLAIPCCGNCRQSNRSCRGYGLRLSWPRKGDGRRSIVTDLHVVAEEVESTVTKNRHKFLNTFYWDISLYYELLETNSTIDIRLDPWTIPKPISLSWSLINGQESKLINHFIERGSRLLTPIHANNLAAFILKVALSDSSPSSKAVLHGILALSSLQLNGDHEALLYKANVISSIIVSLNRMHVSEKISLELLAANMLLCLYELSHASESTRDWALYLGGAKIIIKAMRKQREPYCEENLVLMDWVYYHEVILEFSLLHWTRKCSSCVDTGLCAEGPLSRPSTVKLDFKNLSTVGCSLDVLESISFITQTLKLAPKKLQVWSPEKQEEIYTFERKLSSRKLCIPEFDHPDRRVNITMDLHRLAALIYLNRALLKFTGSEYRHQKLVKDSLSLLSELEVCESGWPLFIIACEAVTDAQRLTVLEVLSQTQQRDSLRSDHIGWIQTMVEKSWIQEDLHSEDPLDYITKMNGVVTTSPFIPIFC